MELKILSCHAYIFFYYIFSLWTITCHLNGCVYVILVRPLLLILLEFEISVAFFLTISAEICGHCFTSGSLDVTYPDV